MRSRFARRTGALLLGLAEVAAAAIALLAVVTPVSAQIDDRFPFLEDRRRRYQQNQPYQQPQWGAPFGFEQSRQQPADSSRAPPPRRAEGTPTTKVMVFGDSMADWLAFGLEEAFSDTPEIGVLRKHRTTSGLIRVEVRGESYDWPSAARDLLNAEKPDYVVMMIGVADRRGIREAIRQQPARPPAGQKQQPQPSTQAQTPPTAQAPQPPAQQQAAAPAVPAPAKPADTEASPQSPAPDAAQDSDQSNVIAPETAIAGTVVHEFRSEKWGELYSRRVDEMIGVLKSRGVPVFWVGLPSIRGSRATSEMVYLNDLYRSRAEKAGITYVDIWDGFVDESNSYNNYGPDLEGQTRRLRSGDGAHFTRAGARKLAHYAEREIRRLMASVTPVATPLPQEPEPDAKAPPTAAAPGLPPRPAASPIMSLTAPKGAGDALLGATPVRTAPADSVVTRVLVKGEPLDAPAGRADDFAWPRRDIVTATGALPPDPVEPPEPAVAGGGGTPTPAAVAAAPKQSAPRPRREAQQQQQQTSGGWGWFGRPQPYETRPQPQQRGFFGGWFGGGRW